MWTDKHAIIGVIEALAQGANIIRFIDRDDRSEDDIKDASKAGIRVLSRRNLESYLFDNAVLDALCDWANNPHKKHLLRKAKYSAIQSSTNRGNPNDDLKRASGDIYKEAKRILGLTSVGNEPKSFMRSTLAPLIKPGMTVYETLKKDIFQI